jgi:hypothetical protein
MSAKGIVGVALLSDAAMAPAAVLNGSVLEGQCEGQLRTGCQGVPPQQQHIEHQDPARPLLLSDQVYAIGRSTAPFSAVGV